MNEPPKQRWGCLQWGIVVGVVGCLSLHHLYIGMQRGGEQMIAENNCRQIILCLKQYARNADSGFPDGRLPDLKSANQVFREFFKEEILLDERIFGCSNSVFNPDHEIGNAPSFEKALMPGECHWMLLKHQTAVSHDKTPVVIETVSTLPGRRNGMFRFGLATKGAGHGMRIA